MTSCRFDALPDPLRYERDVVCECSLTQLKSPFKFHLKRQRFVDVCQHDLHNFFFPDFCSGALTFENGRIYDTISGFLAQTSFQFSVVNIFWNSIKTNKIWIVNLFGMVCYLGQGERWSYFRTWKSPECRIYWQKPIFSYFIKSL